MDELVFLDIISLHLHINKYQYFLDDISVG